MSRKNNIFLLFSAIGLLVLGDGYANAKKSASKVKYIKPKHKWYDYNFGDGSAPFSGKMETNKHTRQPDSEDKLRDFSKRQKRQAIFSNKREIDDILRESNKSKLRKMAQEMLESKDIDFEALQTLISAMKPQEPHSYRVQIGQPKWSKPQLTYRINSYSMDLDPCLQRNVMKKAFRTWEEVIELNFAEVFDNSTVDMDIKFAYGSHGDDQDFDSDGPLLAHAWSRGYDSISGDIHFDDGKLWTLGAGKITKTIGGNSNNNSCVFPFTYKKREYTSCTKVDRNQMWCSTTYNYDKDKKFGFCPSEELFTYGGNSQGSGCVFPFQARGKTYNECTKIGRSDNYRWCATTSNFDKDEKWGFCPDQIFSTTGGNSNGAACHFPFKYQRHMYNECRVSDDENNEILWCSTTPDMDKDGKWGECTQQYQGVNLLQTTIHEIGHVLGLDHSKKEDAIMYSSYDDPYKYELSSDDKKGVLMLYRPRRTELPKLKLENCFKSFPQLDKSVPHQASTKGIPSLRSLTSVDAVVEYNPEIFLVKGNRFWRVRKDMEFHYDKLRQHRPYSLQSQWFGAPAKVDAMVQHGPNQDLWIFSGKRYWEFTRGFKLKENSPQPLTNLGLPFGVLKVDTALVRQKFENGRFLHMFAGKKCYKYDLENRRMIRKQPISRWSKLLRRLDGALEKNSSTTYFFKKKRVYIYDNIRKLILQKVLFSDWLSRLVKF